MASLSLSLSCIGEGNGNPLQCSCLENPRDGGAWWAAVYGVAESDMTVTFVRPERSAGGEGMPMDLGRLGTEHWRDGADPQL